MNRSQVFRKTTPYSVDSVDSPQTVEPALSVLTAYDFPSARLCEQAGVDAILVGDSLANVVLGYDSTRDIGMVEMEVFTGAARRGAPQTHIIADLPYGADETVELALENGRRLIEAGADSVKLEGTPFAQIEALVQAGIPVVGHLGLTPQTASNYKQVGRTPEEARQLLLDATRLSELGCIALVLEHIPSELATQVTRSLSLPTIGIGAGVDTDAQVMVFHDALGLLGSYVPPIAHNFVSAHTLLASGIQQYHQWAQSRTPLQDLK